MYDYVSDFRNPLALVILQNINRMIV